MKILQKDYKRIVIKIGSSLLYSEESGLSCGLLKELSSEISGLIRDEKEIIIVSSGAIALGMSVLKLTDRPKDLAYLQAAAAIGQNELMDIYRRFFQQEGLACAQLLLTWEDFDDRLRYLNAKNTLLRLLKLRALPIINENDTVSTDEIKFGDNDRLSALVSILVSADLLIMLSDVDGLLQKDNKTVVKVVDNITSKVRELACPSKRKTCVGGMLTKIEAASIAVSSGIPCVIANGRQKSVISANVKEPGKFGTVFVPKKGRLAAKKRWIAFGTKPKGEIMVDEGAKKALLDNKSLLSVGVRACRGNFAAGDIVSLKDEAGCEFARGKVQLASKELEAVKGSRYHKEVVHKDNIVVL